MQAGGAGTVQPPSVRALGRQGLVPDLAACSPLLACRGGLPALQVRHSYFKVWDESKKKWISVVVF